MSPIVSPIVRLALTPVAIAPEKDLSRRSTLASTCRLVATGPSNNRPGVRPIDRSGESPNEQPVKILHSLEVS